MRCAGLLCQRILFAIAVIAPLESAMPTSPSRQKSTIGGEENDTGDGESLARLLFEQLRWHLERGGVQHSSRIVNNSILLIRGIKFRTVLNGEPPLVLQHPR